MTRLNVFDAVLCPKHNTIISLKVCRLGMKNEGCPDFKGERKTKNLFPKLAEIDCSFGEVEDCPVCHGAGATTDHHDPCTECGGSGRVGGEEE